MIKNQRELLSDVIWANNKLLIQKTRQCGCTTLLVNNILDIMHQKKLNVAFVAPNKRMIEVVLKKIQERSDVMNYGVKVDSNNVTPACYLPNGSNLELLHEGLSIRRFSGAFRPKFIVVDEALLFNNLELALKQLQIDINRDDTKVILASTPHETENNKQFIDLFKEADKYPLNTKWRLFKLKWFMNGCVVNFFKEINGEFITLNTKNIPLEEVITLMSIGWFPSTSNSPAPPFEGKEYIKCILGEFCE